MKTILTTLQRSWQVLVLLAVTIGVKLYVVGQMRPVIHTDSITFLFLGELDVVRTPGYPLFIEILLSLNDLLGLTADHIQWICLGQIFILGIMNVLLIYDVSHFLTANRWFALSMGVANNFNYFVVGFEFQLMTETLTITLLLGMLSIYLRLFKAKRSWAVLAGLLLVLLIYTRATYLLFWAFLPAVTFVGFYPRSRTKPFFRTYAPCAAIFLLITLMGIGAWSMRNKLKYDYFGVSSLLPYQVRYYTNPLFEKYEPTGDVLLDRVAQVYAEEFNRTGPDSATVFNFQNRLQQEFGLSASQISSLLMRVHLKLIQDHPGAYFRQVPESVRDYYLQYKAYWTAGNNPRFLLRPNIISRLFLKFFQFYKRLFLSPWLLMVVLLASPLVVLIASRTQKNRFHGWLVVEAVIHYTFFVSVLTTSAGINNLRYRQPVEPLILLVFYAAVFYLIQAAIRIIQHKTQKSDSTG